MVGSTLIYYLYFPTDGARRLGCAGGLDLCCRLPASGLWRPEARWPDKVLFSAEKSGALRANGLRARVGTGLVPPAEPLRGKCRMTAGVCWQLGFVLPLASVRAFAAGGSLAG